MISNVIQNIQTFIQMAALSTCQSQSCEKIESCERVSEQN